jgi:hypothetical protein
MSSWSPSVNLIELLLDKLDCDVEWTEFIVFLNIFGSFFTFICCCWLKVPVADTSEWPGANSSSNYRCLLFLALFVSSKLLKPS